ncbi:MAG: hypothetical protein Q7S06_01635 [Nanoarchaeota archaeon]|nr:hypothetical protein [Nanoarchaeota archaeon]
MKRTTLNTQDTRLATILAGVNVALGKRYLSQPLSFQEKRCLRKLSGYIEIAELALGINYTRWTNPQELEQERRLKCLKYTIPADNSRELIAHMKGLVSNINDGNLTREYVDKYQAILSSASTKLMKDLRVREAL